MGGETSREIDIEEISPDIPQPELERELRSAFSFPEEGLWREIEKPRTPRKKPYYGRRITKPRLSKRRYSEAKGESIESGVYVGKRDLCLLVGAFTVFHGHACLSLALNYDITINEQIYSELSDAELLELAQDPLVVFQKRIDRYFLATVNKDGLFGFESGKERWETLCDAQRYAILRIHLIFPNFASHALVALWDKVEGEIEFFDPGGEAYYTEAVTSLLKRITNVNTVKVVDQKNLQILPEDRYCQTWIYYYIYLRLVEGLSPKRIRTMLQDIDERELLRRVEDFWEFLIANS